MKHIDKNSIKHFSVCFLLSLIGAYGMSAAIGASLTKDGTTSNPTDIGAGVTCCLTSSVAQEEWVFIGGYSTAGTFNHIIYNKV